jgi:catechol 2,3-dioxygenase-like lactoylglutathione lyase family enzyme
MPQNFVLTAVDAFSNISTMINMTEAPPTQRLQLALNVKNLDEAIAFYTKMFGTEPARLRPGYANFAIANPPLKLVLFEGSEEGTINHLGVEVTTSDEVIEAEQRLIKAGLETTGIDDTVCCYAEKTETWLHGPDATRWEWYVRHGDSEQMHNTVINGDSTCCPTDPADQTPESAASSDDGPAVCCG